MITDTILAPLTNLTFGIQIFDMRIHCPYSRLVELEVSNQVESWESSSRRYGDVAGARGHDRACFIERPKTHTTHNFAPKRFIVDRNSQSLPLYLHKSIPWDNNKDNNGWNKVS